MKRFGLSACLIAVSGLASGQQAGPGDFSGSDFQPIFSDSSNRVFPLNFTTSVVGQANAAQVQVPLKPGETLDGESMPITVEGDGVRLPDEQFSLP